MTNDSGGAQSAAAAPQRQESAMTWRERIVAARERGAFTDEERLLAGDWRTCAVGEQHAAMPHVVIYIDGAFTTPQDGEMLRLGSGSLHHGFAYAIHEGNFALAESLLDAIEDRALALKRETFGASSDEATPTS